MKEEMQITTFMIRTAVIAAGYAAVTILIAPIAYGPIQFRISDVLMPIPYIPYFGLSGVIGITIGTLIANVISPYGFWDIVLGTLANLISGIGSYYARRIPNKLIGRIIAVLIPVFVVTFLIGYILLTIIVGLPLLISVGGVFVGELVTAGIGGYILISRLEKVLQESVE